MKITETAIHTLTTRLTSDNADPLSSDEKALLSAALVELAAAQALIARHTRLLHLHGELHNRLRDIANEALDDVARRLDAPDALHEYDFEKAQAARQSLLAEIEAANSTRAALAATLQFVRRIAGAGA